MILSFLNNEVPDELKTTIVTPIFKEGIQFNVTNYRPISQTSPITFIESIAKEQFSWLLE